jgi:hypothetical protein
VLDNRALKEIQIVARVQTRGVAKREFPEILLGHKAFFDQLERFRHHLPEIGHVEMREVGAEHRPYSFAESATAEKLRRRRSLDLKKQIAARLRQLAKDLELDEMVVITWTYDPARHRSYELLAEAFGWAITKRFSTTGCAIEEREYRSGIRLTNYLVTAIVSELVSRSAASSVVSLECMFNHYANHRCRAYRESTALSDSHRRITAIAKDLSFLSALSFYYTVSCRLAVATFEEKGLLRGLTHGVLEYATPLLVVVLTLLVLISCDGMFRGPA